MPQGYLRRSRVRPSHRPTGRASSLSANIGFDSGAHASRAAPKLSRNRLTLKVEFVKLDVMTDIAQHTGSLAGDGTVAEMERAVGAGLRHVRAELHPAEPNLVAARQLLRRPGDAQSPDGGLPGG